MGRITTRRAAGVGLALIIVAATMGCTRPSIIDTIVGGGPPFTACFVNTPPELCSGWLSGLATDAAGNVYYAEQLSGYDYAVRRRTPAGVVSTIAGGGTNLADGATGADARLNGERPFLARGPGGTIFVTSIEPRPGEPGEVDSVIRRIGTNGVVTTVPGSRTYGASAMAVDPGGNVVAFAGCGAVVRYGPFGGTTIVGGQVGNCGWSGDDGPAALARLRHRAVITVDAANNIYFVQDPGSFADSRVIRRIDPGGTITRIAGTGTRYNIGDGAPALDASLDDISTLVPDGAGGLLIGFSFVNGVRRIDAGGMIDLFAGNLAADGTTDGVLATATSVRALALARNAAGETFALQEIPGGARIQRIDPAGIITTIVGRSDSFGDGGPATEARLSRPQAVAHDAAGNLFIADTWNHRIRKVTPAGIISTVAGGSIRGYAGDGGPATASLLNRPLGLAFDDAGNLYIGDAENHRVRMIDTGGTITTFAGDGTAADPFGEDAGDGGSPTAAQVSFPSALAFHDGTLYIGNMTRHRVRAVTGGTITSTIAGTDDPDDTGYPISDLAVDTDGSLLVASVGLTRVDEGGESPVSGFTSAVGLAVDAAGRLYVSDGPRVRLRETNGTISTAAGAQTGFAGDGGRGAAAFLNGAAGLSIDPDGNLAIADSSNHRIRLLDWEGA